MAIPSILYRYYCIAFCSEGSSGVPSSMSSDHAEEGAHMAIALGKQDARSGHVVGTQAELHAEVQRLLNEPAS